MSRTRTKIRSDNVRHEIVALLRAKGDVATAEIMTRMEPVAARNGLAFRGRAVTYCLTALKREGVADNPQRGRWRWVGSASD
jgi:hypothetical protein